MNRKLAWLMACALASAAAPALSFAQTDNAPPPTGYHAPRNAFGHPLEYNETTTTTTNAIVAEFLTATLRQ